MWFPEQNELRQVWGTSEGRDEDFSVLAKRAVLEEKTDQAAALGLCVKDRDVVILGQLPYGLRLDVME